MNDYNLKQQASNQHDYFFWYRFIAELCYRCLRYVTKVEEAVDLLNISPPLIFAYNHNNYFETIVLSSYLMHRWRQRQVSFVVDWMYGQLPIVGWLLQSFQPVYVYTKRARWDFLNRRRLSTRHNIVEECVRKLQTGCSLGIFPEGTRNGDNGILKRGRRGVGEIALHSQTPVLPVGIAFPGRQRCGRIPAVGKVILRFGRPLDFPQEIGAWQRAEQDAALSQGERERLRVFLCRRITHTVMQELARLSGKHYPYSQPAGLWRWPKLHAYL